jgi:hypothetical protein
MPIRFRCSHCNRLLGIARRKAGAETNCPHCGASITVPKLDEPGSDGPELAEIDALLNPTNVAATASPPSPTPAATYPSPPTLPRPVTPPSRPNPQFPEDEHPLFERDVDSLLGAANKEDDPSDAKQAPRPTSGMDSLSLGGEHGQLVLSSQKVTALVVVVVVLLALAFTAGFLIASR